MRRYFYLLASLCLASPGVSEQAANPDAARLQPLMELVGQTRNARVEGDIASWLAAGQQALALTPDHPDMLISVARASAAAGERQQALADLQQAVRRGAGLEPDRFPEFKSLETDPVFQTIASAAKRNEAAVANATEFARLPGREAEGIAYDPVSKQLFAGSEGELLAIDRYGKVTTFISGGGLRQLLGIKVDAKRRLVWLVTGRFPNPPGGAPSTQPDVGTSGIRAYNIDTRALIASYELDERPLFHGFNDLALANDGTVYVTDSSTGSVYKVAPRAKSLELLVRDARMSFPNGIALSNDQKTLYVACVEGIYAVDPRTGEHKLMPVPENVSVNSIDGLLIYKGALIGVQASPYLHRLVRIRLAPDSQSIEGATVLTSRTPAQYNQTTAAIGDGHIYMVGGTPVTDVYTGRPLAEPIRAIWRVPLGK